MTIGDALVPCVLIVAVLIWNVFRHSRFYKDRP